MARLNEPLVPATESLDALKRRFIRQNREIARVNSSQSQRIRNLETEISRLLAENISLREQAIRANEEADKLRTSNRLGRDVLALKEKLAAKVAEVNIIVEQLGGLPEKAARRSSIKPRRNASLQSPVRSPDARDWRNRQNLGGILNPEQEGRLPAILEDKYYPRRTLDIAELRALGVEEANGDAESPDIGPPPVVHFDVNDPIVFDSNKSPSRVSGGIVLEEDSAAPTGSFETRRKRRTSSLVHDLTGVEGNEVTKAEVAQPQVPATKPVPKRKVDAYEFDDGRATATQDDFVFQKKPQNTTDRSKPSRFASRPNRQHITETQEAAKSPQKSSQPTRLALAPKTTNSPTKRKTSSTLLKKDLLNTNPEDEPKPRINRVTAMGKIEKPRHIDIPPTVEAPSRVEETQPKTPGAGLMEVMSPEPVSTEPSTKTRSTAEIAFTNSLEDVLNGSIGRGSRRARAAVSYAEPNLRDKMRRPDKKLVGAVEGLAKSTGSEGQLSRSLNSEPAELTQARENLRLEGPASPQAEHTRLGAQQTASWTSSAPTDATSPLGDKQRVQLAEKRHKRTFSEVDGTSSKLLPRRLADEVSSSLEQLSIFDPPSSSPIAPKHDEPDRPPSRSSRETLASTRRASTTNASNPSTVLKTRRHSIQVQPQSANPPPSRPSSAMSSRGSAARDTASTKLKRASSVQALTRTQETSPAGDEVDVVMSGRTMTTRRRSMMV